MAGNEIVTEGFKEGQVGSSAMPHKMNTRSCERVNGLAVVTRGYLSMVGELAGDQWNEGDVSCSVVRRVALPDAFFAADGLFQTFLTVLDEFGAFPAVIQRELDRYLPFLATTKVLMAAVRNGVGREAAHEAIKEAAVGVALDDAPGPGRQRRLRPARRRRAARPHRGPARRLVADPITFTGAAVAQTQAVVPAGRGVAARHPDGGGVLARRDPRRRRGHDRARHRRDHPPPPHRPRARDDELAQRRHRPGREVPGVPRRRLGAHRAGLGGVAHALPLRRPAVARPVGALAAAAVVALVGASGLGVVEARVEKRTGIEGWFDVPSSTVLESGDAPPRRRRRGGSRRARSSWCSSRSACWPTTPAASCSPTSCCRCGCWSPCW